MQRKAEALVDLRFALLGPGRVGTSLALWALGAGARLEAVAGGRAGPLHARLAGKRCTRDELAAVGADLLLIAVADTVFDAEVRRLARTRCRVVLHVCGSRPAAALKPLDGSGAALGSLHPLWPFARVLETPPEGIVFGIDGDPAALALAARLARAWGGATETIPAQSRLLYHLGASLAAGGVATVLAGVARMARQLDLGEGVLEGYRRLAAAAVSGADLTGAASSVTGPVARGDSDLVLAQWRALAAVDAQALAVARALARWTLSQVGEREALAEGHRRILRALEEEEADEERLS